MELSVLCNAEIGLVMFNENGRLFQYSSNGNIDKLLQRYSLHSQHVHENRTNGDLYQQYYGAQNKVAVKEESTEDSTETQLGDQKPADLLVQNRLQTKGYNAENTNNLNHSLSMDYPTSTPFNTSSVSLHRQQSSYPVSVAQLPQSTMFESALGLQHSRASVLGPTAAEEISILQQGPYNTQLSDLNSALNLGSQLRDQKLPASNLSSVVAELSQQQPSLHIPATLSSLNQAASQSYQHFLDPQSLVRSAGAVTSHCELNDAQLLSSLSGSAKSDLTSYGLRQLQQSLRPQPQEIQSIHACAGGIDQSVASNGSLVGRGDLGLGSQQLEIERLHAFFKAQDTLTDSQLERELLHSSSLPGHLGVGSRLGRKFGVPLPAEGYVGWGR